MKTLLLLLFCGLLPLPSYGSLLVTAGNGGVVEGVSGAKTAEMQVQGRQYSLQSLGIGLRYKKVLFIKADVYVGQLFSSDPEKFVRTESGALGSLAQAKAAAMEMTFLRDVGADTMEKAFREAFAENGVNTSQEPFRSLLAAVKSGSPAIKGKAMVVAAAKDANKLTILYEDAKGRVSTFPAQAGDDKKIFSLWLGKPSDSGVQSLQRQIVSP